MAVFQKALLIQVALIGNHHPNFATTLNNIGCQYILDDKFDNTLLCYEDALCRRCEKLGNDLLNYATTALNAGQILHQKRKHDKALNFYFKFLCIVLA
eukprot:12273738-Ditylum_brightwellii.AAC.1